MPANLVRPGTEQQWNEAKAQAKKQGHAEDWPYITAIYKQMTLNKSATFQKSLIPSALRMHGRWPGQVPDQDAMEAKRLMEYMPGPFKASMLLDHTYPVVRVSAVVDGLGFSRADEQAWITFLESVLQNTGDEVAVKQAVHARMQEQRLDPAVRKVIAQRTTSFVRTQLQKSGDDVEVYSPEDALLLKAEARGGSYHRRVTKADGKHQYFYDPEKYAASDGAHLNGEDALHSRVSGLVSKRLAEKGKDGAGLDDMADLTKKFGAKTVAKCMVGAMKKGSMEHKNGRFRSIDQNDDETDKEEPVKKSLAGARFILSR